MRDAAGNDVTISAADFTLTAPPGLPITDTFTGSDGTNVVGRSVAGFTWIADTDNLTNVSSGGTSPQIKTNAAESNSGGRAALLDVGATNVRATAQVFLDASVPAGQGARLCVAGSASAFSGLFVLINHEEMKLYRGTGSTWAQVGATHADGVAPGESKSVSLEYDGSTGIVKLDGVTVITGAATGHTGTRVGFGFNAATTAARVRLDNFAVVAL